MISLDEIEAVVDALRDWRDEYGTDDYTGPRDCQALTQAVEIIEVLVEEVIQARRALLQINYFTAEALGEKIGRVDDEPSEG